MKRDKFRKKLCVLTWIFFLCLFIISGNVVRGSGHQEGKLTIQLNDLGTPMKDVEFIVYKIAEIDYENSKWILDNRLLALNTDIDLNEEKNASKWDEAAFLLTGLVKKAKIPSIIGLTDEKGNMTLSGLEYGMYLVIQNCEADYGMVSPFLIAFSEQIEGEESKEIIAKPKGELNVPKEEETQDKTVDTSDPSKILSYLVILLGALFSIIWLIKKKSHFSLFVLTIITMVLNPVLQATAAEETTGENVKAEGELIPTWATDVLIETPPDSQYVYQFSDSCPLYQRGQYRFGCGYYNCAPSPVILLVDGSKYNESLGTTWTANNLEYIPGVSNYELVYCADFDTDTVSDQFYKKVNVEDSTYFESVEDAYKLRAIIGNTYPFVSAVDMVKDLNQKGIIKDSSILLHGKTFEDELSTSDIDVGQLIAATQMAVWVVCNDTMDSAYVRAGTHTYYTLHKDNASMQPNGKLNQVKGYPNADSDTETTFDMTEGQAENINAIYSYLMALEPVTEEEAEKLNQLVITDVKYGAIKAGTGNYDVAVDVILNTAIKENDNITIRVSSSKPDSSGKIIEDIKVFQSQGTDSVIGKDFSFHLKDVPAGAEIAIELSGEQYLNQGVYFYEPYLREGENERTSSQNMVGASMGYTPVKTTAVFNIDDEEIVWETKMPSTGGEGTVLFYSAGMIGIILHFCLYINQSTKAKNKK